MSIPRVVKGLELVDDEGDEVVVSKISESKGIATLKTADDGDSYTMSLRELRGKLRDGEFAALDAEDDDTNAAEDDAAEDDGDEEDDEGDEGDD